MIAAETDAGLQAELERLRRRVSELERTGSADRRMASAQLESAIGLRQDRFESSPIPMTEEDWSEARRLVDALRADGITDIRAYVREHPAFLGELAPAVKIVDVNPAAVRMYKASDKAELLAAFNAPPDLSSYNPSTGLSDIFVELVDRFGKGETRVELEGPDTTLDGAKIYVRTTTSIGRGHEDDWGLVLQTVEDFTSRKAAEESLRLAERMDAVGQLTGGVAHDFNNLLAIIQGNAEILREDAGAESASVAAILRAAHRGAEVTRRLLAYARKQPLQPCPLDTGALVRDMQELVKWTLSENIEIEVFPAPDLWRAMADSGQLENALLSLAINARHAMAEGGKLTIACGNARLDAKQAALQAAPMAGDPAAVGEFVLISVTDTGTGMPAEVAARAFEPFFTTKGVGEGSGLGLSMVYGFARQSGGHVTIDSEPGRGTTVNLYLPRAEVEAPAPSVVEPVEEPVGRGESVLIVEDDPDVREITATMLRDLGYSVLEVAEAESAQAVLGRGTDVDLLLADVVLPGSASGPELARRAQRQLPNLAVVFMSGYPAETADRQSLIGGDHVLLSKPFGRRQLAQTLRAQLDGQTVSGAAAG